MFAIVYLRPDGWWEAGRSWDSFAGALKDGEDHEWNGSAWGIVMLDDNAPKIEAAAQQDIVFTAVFKSEASITIRQEKEDNVIGEFAFQPLKKWQNDLSDLSVKAHETGYYTTSGHLASFRTRTEELYNDLVMYFHDHEEVLRKLTGE